MFFEDFRQSDKKARQSQMKSTAGGDTFWPNTFCVIWTNPCEKAGGGFLDLVTQHVTHWLCCQFLLQSYTSYSNEDGKQNGLGM